jgi:hypothetical protein
VYDLRWVSPRRAREKLGEDVSDGASDCDSDSVHHQ